MMFHFHWLLFSYLFLQVVRLCINERLNSKCSFYFQWFCPDISPLFIKRFSTGFFLPISLALGQYDYSNSLFHMWKSNWQQVGGVSWFATGRVYWRWDIWSKFILLCFFCFIAHIGDGHPLRSYIWMRIPCFGVFCRNSALIGSR